MRSVRCPDCGVSMESVTLRTGDGYGVHVETGDRRDGLLGTLGMNENAPVEALLCPECGRLQFYADLED